MEMHLRAVNEIILCFSVKSVVPVSSSSYENQSSIKKFYFASF